MKAKKPMQGGKKMGKEMKPMMQGPMMEKPKMKGEMPKKRGKK